MYFSLGNSLKNGSFFYFEIEVGPNPTSIEAHLKKVFHIMELRTDAAIKAFDRFMGRAYFQWLINETKKHSELYNAITNPKGKITIVNVRVFPEIVEKLRRFGINLLTNSKGKSSFGSYAPTFNGNVKKFQNFKPVPTSPVAQWTTLQKLDAVIKRVALLLPEDVGKELLALLDPASLAIMAVVVAAWAVSHFFGVGEIADVILLIVGVISIGLIAWKAGEHLIGFAVVTVSAKSDEDLDKAAENLSKAVALLGVQVVMLLLLKKAPKVFREPRVTMKQGNPSVPLTIKTVGEPPVTKGKMFYEPPEVKIYERSPFATKDVPGSTDQWGRSSVFPGRNSTLKDIELTKFHEEFHRLLAPKFQLFPRIRQIRAILKTNSYLKSYILRYVEEALAETTAQIRAKGFKWQEIWEGIKFPIGDEAYVTIAKMNVEAKGILLGPVNVGGMIYRVYLSYTEDW